MNRERRSWLMDMDGVIVQEDHLVPGADGFVARLTETGHPFLILTNNSMYTTRDLAARLSRLGLNVTSDAIWTSALATAKFLADQRPGGTAFAIGEAGLTTALYEVGYTLARPIPTTSSSARRGRTASSASRVGSSSSVAAPASSPPTLIRPGRARTVRCRRPAPSRRSSHRRPACSRTTSASRIP